MGKLGEELGELQAVAARCIIQGINETDPGSGQVNRERLEHEIADVLAQCRVTIRALSLDAARIADRVQTKKRQMAEWESHFQVPSSETAALRGEGPWLARNAERGR